MKRWWLNKSPRPAPEDADEAVVQARRALADARNFSRRVEDVAERLQETRRRNHFAEAVARAIRGV